MSVAVTIEDLSVTLGQMTILSGVSLEVAEGEFLTLLGPSGSGKTTTLNALAGFVHHTHGRVTIGGKVVDELPPHRRNIGFVFQSYALFPHMTVAENVGYPLRARKVPRDRRERMVGDALELVRLPNVGDRPVRSLSGGQQQRVALARALVFEPNLVLLDEPLAALDKQLRDAMQLEVRRIHERTGMTTIAVTHDQVEAMTMSDRIAILDQGRISQIGTPTDVYQRPANLFVAGFLGEANLLDAHDGRVPALDVRTTGASDGTAVVRPEDLEIGGPDEPGAAATVEEASYQGTRLRVGAQLATGERLVVSAPVNATTSALRGGNSVRVRPVHATVHAVPETTGTASTTEAMVAPA
ncbi:MAG TPA: ABC transporter ATP-binding protein [Thermoleophilaceae bacterium]|jgi:putative spermidine/putrescine transport system ATP-binding protein|nr:ABC transporter ATP-binding protein [Thermoleophilaceae bacterium]